MDKMILNQLRLFGQNLIDACHESAEGGEMHEYAKGMKYTASQFISLIDAIEIIQAAADKQLEIVKRGLE